MTIDTDDLDDRQLRLLNRLTREFEQEPHLDAESGPVLYRRLRRHLMADGATEEDFEFLTGHLVRLIIESGKPGTVTQKSAQLTLVSDVFALRNFNLLVDEGTLVTFDFADPPTVH